MLEPAARLQNAQSWWIASELVRRHPHLFIIELHPMDGFYDSLGLIDLNADKKHTVVDINRPGSVHVHSNEGFQPITLTEALSFDDAHEVVKRVETAARWGAPTAAAKTTARPLSYRVIARVLASMVNDRHVWDVRSEFSDSWDGDNFNGYLHKFPFAQHLLETGPKLGVPGEPFSHIWALKRDDKPVAILDTAGRVVTESGYRELLPLYRHTNRSLTRVIADALGDVLP